MINGKLHRMVEDERRETTPEGNIRIIKTRRYVPIDDQNHGYIG